MRKSILRAEARAVSGRGAVLHASAVDLGGRALVMLAPSGGGKSTAARLLESGGMERLADDSVIVVRGTDGVLRAVACASWRWATGRESVPRPLGWLAFLEKGPPGIWRLDPRYAAWRALLQRQLMAYGDLLPEERRPFREQTREMFRAVPALLIRHDLGDGLGEMTRGLL